MASASASPSRGLRAKTSDFIRGVGQSSLARQSQTDLATPPAGNSSLAIPTIADDGASMKKKITRIPLFTRTRRKSNHSASSSPYVGSGSQGYSSEVGESGRSREPSTDRRPSEPAISVQPPPLPTPSVRAHSSSLTSKLAAHFSHSRSSKPAVTQAEPAKPAVQSSGLHPRSTRSPSLESGSSTGTKSRSTTPRPTITVSLSPDDLSPYHDLFVRPSDLAARAELARQAQKLAESETANAGPPATPATGKRSPEPVVYKRGQTPASAIAAAIRHCQTSSVSSDQAPSPPPKNSKIPSDRKSHERNDASSVSRPSGTRESPRSSPSGTDMEKGIPPSLQRRTSVATGSVHSADDAPPLIRSRMKQPSSQARTRPPSIPLPLPPTPTLPNFQPPSPVTRHPNGDSISSFSSRDGSSRPRAHTISSGVPSSASTPRLNRSGTTRRIPTPPIVPSLTEKEGFDIDTASPEDLRQALKDRNLQYDELSTFVLKTIEANVAQIVALEKRNALLESENIKADKTIQGLVHIINGHEQPKALPPGILNQTRFAPVGGAAPAAGNGAESDQETYRSGRPSLPNRLAYHSDSGGESYATSGAESIRASGGSGTESMASSIFNRNKKVRRAYVAGDASYLVSRPSILRSGKVPPSTAGPPDKSLPDVPYPANTKRTSLGSMSVSPSSSTSSLLPPSPSITMSSLSAIPEGAPSLRPPRQEAADERRMTHTANRVSMSSMASSSTAASSAYSANMKRSRPPSIAQVLESSPKVDDVMDKIRQLS